ncbi:ribosomal protein S12 methylthiotransferase accessory factor [Saccharothrix coeruleofusca]|uniref:YcaO-like family protein n=1 Tax=Saccharothrix coeruleofusca TaxID=33919 RepID=UPI001AE82125|nr:YcaO-like family protein [Saccharothrix coeruleofusca]MBP2334901.1 ribosomal protein S12 methylthiotransferase accessory factor [Saccharothrix coeruleofusca]
MTRKIVLRGTHRAVPPEVTWSRIEPLLGDFGITRVADVTHLDHIGIPVMIAVRPLSETYGTSQGKGATPLLARISAAMESIEMWHAENFDRPQFEATAHDLELPYPIRALNVPPLKQPLERVRLSWTRGRTVVGGDPVPLPVQLLRLSFVGSSLWEPHLFRDTSNGLASGNSFPEACLHGIYEVVERHALASLSSSHVDSRAQVDLSTVDDEHLVSLLDRLAGAGTQCEVAMIPNELSIPVFVAFIWSPLYPLVAAGSGAHMDVTVAMSRAITEAVQTRLTRICTTRDNLPSDYQPPHVFDPRLSAGAGRSLADVTEGYGATHDDLDAELREVAGRVERLTGMPPVVVDMSTRSDVFSVVRVVCPGLDYPRGGGNSIPRAMPAKTPA